MIYESIKKNKICKEKRKKKKKRYINVLYIN